MGQKKRKVVPSRHLVCGNCASWIQHEGSGCEKKWADTKVDGFVFTCKGCTEVVALVKEVEGLRQMVEGMKGMIGGILPVFGNRIQGYRNSKRMAVNGMVERLCKEEDVGYVDLWDSFKTVGREDMYGRDGLHLSGKGVAVFAEGLSGAVASGLGKVRYLN